MINTTYNAVKYACLLLLEKHTSTTTTLDVKNLLRQEGFFAEQSEVSAFLLDISNTLPLEFTHDGTHRIYSLPDPSTLVATVQSVTIPPTPIPTPIKQTVGTKFTYTQRDGDIVEGYTSLPVGCTAWKVSSDGVDAVYVDWYTFSRSQARQAFASVNDVPFHNVRTKRV